MAKLTKCKLCSNRGSLEASMLLVSEIPFISMGDRLCGPCRDFLKNAVSERESHKTTVRIALRALDDAITAPSQYTGIKGQIERQLLRRLRSPLKVAVRVIKRRR